MALIEPYMGLCSVGLVWFTKEGTRESGFFTGDNGFA